MKKIHRFRPWADLPTDILSNIADRLPIIEFLSFRGTCKDFRRASYNASAENESRNTPWLILRKPNDNASGTYLFYNHNRSKPYVIDFPDLIDCIFLASYQGWLLVFKKGGSVFFFSPFSRAKIDLPDFPYKQIRHNATAFSELPTSPHCIVSIRTPNEVLVISKGQTAWTRHKVLKTICHSWPATTRMSCAGFDHKTQAFYYLHNLKHALKYSVKDNKVYPHPVDDIVKDIHGLPFRFVEDPLHEAYKCRKRYFETSDPFQLKDGEHLNLCGCTLDNLLPDSHQQLLFPSEFANQRPRDERWGVWIQPRFFVAHPHHHW